VQLSQELAELHVPCAPLLEPILLLPLDGAKLRKSVANGSQLPTTHCFGLRHRLNGPPYLPSPDFRFPARQFPALRAPTHFPIVRESAINGHG